MKLSRSLAGLAIAALFLGCNATSGSLPVANVSGNVNLDGKPLTKGTISFSTDGRQPQIFEIRDGSYQGAAMVGSNRIQISSKRPSAAAAAAKDPSVAARMKSSGITAEEEIIPASYNVNSKETRVVESGSPNKFDFEIKSK
jgi:hypothetical protein